MKNQRVFRPRRRKPSWVKQNGGLVLALLGCVGAGYILGRLHTPSEPRHTLKTQPQSGDSVPRQAGKPPAAQKQAPLPATQSPKEDAEMSRKIGQMLMVGLSGKTLTAKEARFLRAHHIGSVILMRNNISRGSESFEQVRALTASIRQASTILPHSLPAFVATDQEFGKVGHLRKPAGFPEYPSAWLLAEQDQQSPGILASAADDMARHLHAVGVTMNLAPVLDVVADPKRGVINTRSFGDNADIVGSLGVQFLQAHQHNSILAVGKHFPGHGMTQQDTHNQPVIVNLSAAEMERHLSPFRESIANGLDAIMISHISYTCWEKTPRPALLSPTVLHELLREKLGFQGLIISDDLTRMQGIRRDYQGRPRLWEQIVCDAVIAGADVLLVQGHGEAERAIAVLLAASKRDLRLRDAINASAKRVFEMKLKYGLFALDTRRQQ